MVGLLLWMYVVFWVIGFMFYGMEKILVVLLYFEFGVCIWMLFF